GREQELLKPARNDHRLRHGLLRDAAHGEGSHQDQAVCRQGAEHGQQLRLSGPRRLLRRDDLPPRHKRLHGAGRGPDRHGDGRSRLQDPRRVPPGPPPRQARHPLDGELGAEHGRLAVLYHPYRYPLARRAPRGLRRGRRGHGGPERYPRARPAEGSRARRRDRARGDRGSSARL
ncbi:MAG: Peptidyl-prolyl cis-trans isomerase, partial [uncultured Rubrobacteraceae bacterium]